ncbi:hypothetical protein WKW80_27785 [Variovorax humicola]|uniref:Tli3-like domain-containing protein n=1 Tax=Variovorax humicola TaxID=1769758 RepID=A0ABU8W725_9BURK
MLYRIDDNRYFEDASEAGHFCENGSPIYYVDKAQGIRSYVVKMDGVSMGSNFIIDAANDQYLIGPATRGNTDCSSGGGYCRGDRLPYSTDAGRTWKRADALSPTAPVTVTGSLAYAIRPTGTVLSLDLTKPVPEMKDWQWRPDASFPPPLRKAPIDNIFHCTANGKE